MEAEIKDISEDLKEMIEANRKSPEENGNSENVKNSISTRPISLRSTRSKDPNFLAKQKSFLAKIHAVVSDHESPPTSEPECNKRKRESMSFPAPKKKKQEISSGNVQETDEQTDSWCWECHKEGVFICCEMCPRVFHLQCANLEVEPEDDWACSVCHSIMQAENIENRSRAMQLISVDQLCVLLKFALNRINKMPAMSPFSRAVDPKDFPTYWDIVVHPMNFVKLYQNIKRKFYGSTEAFLADVKWILHNSIIFNGANSKVTSLARTLIKVLKQELSEVETCPDCYENAHKKPDRWFTEACRSAHPLIWAKLKGFPHWPAKAVKWKESNVDVRFFGRHDRSWIPVKDCVLFSEQMPFTLKVKNKALDNCLTEVSEHITKLKEKFGKFVYAPNKTPFNPYDLDQIKMMLPFYKGPSILRIKPHLSRSFTTDDDASSITSNDSNYSKFSRKSLRDRSNISTPDIDFENDTTDFEDFGLQSATDDTEMENNLDDIGLENSAIEFESSTENVEKSGVSLETDSLSQVEANNEENDVENLKQLEETENETPFCTDNARSTEVDKQSDICDSFICEESTASAELEWSHNKSKTSSVEGKILDKTVENRESELTEIENKLKEMDSDSQKASKPFNVYSNEKCDFLSMIEDRSPSPVQDKGVKEAEVGAEKCVLGEEANKPKNTGVLEQLEALLSGNLVTDYAKVKTSNKTVETTDKIVKTIDETTDNLVENADRTIAITDKATEITDKPEETTKETINFTTNTETPSLQNKIEFHSSLENLKNSLPDSEHIAENISFSDFNDSLDEDDLLTGPIKDSISKPILSFDNISSAKDSVLESSKILSFDSSFKSSSIANVSLPSSIQVSSVPSSISVSNLSFSSEVSSVPNVSLPYINVSNIPQPSSVQVSTIPSTIKESKMNTSNNDSHLDLKGESPMSTSETLIENFEKKFVPTLLENNAKKSSELEKKNKTDEKEINTSVSTEGVKENTNFSSDLVESMKNKIISECKNAEKPNLGSKDKIEDLKLNNLDDLQNFASRMFHGVTISAKPTEDASNQSKISESISEKNASSTESKKNERRLSKDSLLEEDSSRANILEAMKIVNKNAIKRSNSTSSFDQSTFNEVTISVAPSQQENKESNKSEYKNSQEKKSSVKIEENKNLANLPCGSSVTLSAIGSENNHKLHHTSIKTSPPQNRDCLKLTECAKTSRMSPSVTIQPIDEKPNLSKLNFSSNIISHTSQSTVTTTFSTSQSHSNPQFGMNVCSSASPIFNPPPFLSPSLQSPNSSGQRCMLGPQIPGLTLGPGQRPPVALRMMGNASPSMMMPGRVPMPMLRHLPPDAGPLSTELSKHSHKLAEMMRSSLEDVLNGLVGLGTPEARLAAVQLELERSNWRHQQELLEVRHNADVMLVEFRSSLEAEKIRCVEEVRKQMENKMLELRRQMEHQMGEKLKEMKRQAEAEKQRAIEETKKKQWCSQCGKEALFFCCWNTSYCDYPCQQAHWPEHMSVCGQNDANGTVGQNSESNSMNGDILNNSNDNNLNAVAAQNATANSKSNTQLFTDQLNTSMSSTSMGQTYSPMGLAGTSRTAPMMGASMSGAGSAMAALGAMSATTSAMKTARFIQPMQNQAMYGSMDPRMMMFMNRGLQGQTNLMMRGQMQQFRPRFM